MAVIPKTTAIDYWENMHAGAQEACDQLGYRLTWIAPQSENNHAQQAAMVEEVIRQRVDAIVLAPSHGSVLASAVRHAKAEGIPLVLVDSPVMVDPSEYVAYIGVDETHVGKLAALRVGERLKGAGKVGILGVSPTVEAAVQRERAFANTLQSSFPGVRIVDVRYGLSNHFRSREIMRDMLQAVPDMGALFASDSFASRGALAARQDLKSKALLVCVGQERYMQKALAMGNLDAMVVRDQFWLGRRAVEILHDALQGRPVHSRRIDTPCALATAANITQPEIRQMVEWKQVRQ